jgi:hypothetical protein
MIKREKGMSQYREKSYYEIQLDHKQLIVVFFAIVAICVVMFLLGVMVGKGKAGSAPQTAGVQPRIQQGREGEAADKIKPSPVTLATPASKAVSQEKVLSRAESAQSRKEMVPSPIPTPVENKGLKAAASAEPASGVKKTDTSGKTQPAAQPAKIQVEIREVTPVPTAAPVKATAKPSAAQTTPAAKKTEIAQVIQTPRGESPAKPEKKIAATPAAAATKGPAVSKAPTATPVPTKAREINVSELPMDPKQGYSVHVRAYLDSKLAQEMRVKLKNAGYPAYIDTPDKGTYSVWVGKFVKESDAMKVKGKLEKEQNLKGLTIVRK